MHLIDSHEDLAYNILSFGRDYSLPAYETRRRERGTLTPERNGDTLLGYPDYRRGKVAVVFGSLFAAPSKGKAGEWETLVYRNIDEANRLYRRQLDVYRKLVDDHPDMFRLVLGTGDLREVLQAWDAYVPPEENPEEAESGKRDDEEPPAAGPAVGLVMLMEGAEGVRSPGELEEWWEAGVRIIGPAWVGTRFCGGTNQPGPLTKEGYALLEGMGSFGFGLDLSHMDEEAALQALDVYPGTILASHSNAKALLKGVESNRHLSDRLIAGLLERDGVIGIVPCSGFLKPGWKTGDRKDEVSLTLVAAQIDYICQMAGDARHVGLGTDFDGGFGWQSVPAEIDTIADLQKLVPLLAERGYSDEDIAAVFGENWARVLGAIFGESL